MTTRPRYPVVSNFDGFMKRIAECNSGAALKNKFYKFTIDKIECGFIKPDFAEKLTEFQDVFSVFHATKSVELNPQIDTFDERTKRVEDVLATLRQRGEVNQWVGELYPVGPPAPHPPLLNIARGSANAFGIFSYGVHVNGFTWRAAEGGDGREKLHVWVARRSREKPTWPGKLDHIVAGGQPHDLSFDDNVVKECQEEASIPLPLARTAVPTGMVSCEYEHATGNLKRDILMIYDLELPPSFTPVPNDGEVESFFLQPIEEVAQTVSETQEYKENCTLVIIDFMIRHGYVRPDQAGYLQLMEALRPIRLA